MDATETLEALRDDRETELSRLGSSKSLFAATGGEMDADHVLAAAADVAGGARDVYADWADDEDGAGADFFRSVADREADRYETIAGKLDDHDPDPPAVYGHLAGVTGTVERAGALLGETLVVDAHLGQVVGFFVGDADPRTASTFREMGSTVDDRREEALELVDAVCASDGDYERTLGAADAVVGVAYDEYVDRLEAQGVNPKPVC